MLRQLLSASTTRAKAIVAIVALAAGIPMIASNTVKRASAQAAPLPPAPAPLTADQLIDARRRADFDAMESFRPGYTFWHHVFTTPDGSIAYGSAKDGRLLALFPASKTGDWTRQATWVDPALKHVLDGQRLSRKLSDRRDEVEKLIEHVAGPVLNNSTRGDALIPNARRYGGFLAEWGAIYERFGVPAEIGLAQVVLESGLNPTRRSEANAVGFCQWLQRNWKRLNDLSPTPIEGKNQTTQAPFCAAYLSVLATKYGSFIPALSEHNAGGTNVGRTLINGEVLGAHDVRAQYFLGSQFAHELRALNAREYKDVYRTYGPRSYLYAEMVFGNTVVVKNLIASTRQESIYAMRTPRALRLAEIVSKTGLTEDEVRRFNPAVTKVTPIPARGTLYLPFPSELGEDVAFWRRPASPSYLAVLNDFMLLKASAEQWDDPAFAPVLTALKDRFRATHTEEGTVMDTVLAYVMDQAYTSKRRDLLDEFRNSEQVRRLVQRGVVTLDASRARSGAIE
jgi:Transglycosylase SLT domain